MHPRTPWTHGGELWAQCTDKPVFARMPGEQCTVPGCIEVDDERSLASAGVRVKVASV